MNGKVYERYIVWTNYGSEGWKIALSTDDFQEAVKQREMSLSNGNYEVIITEYIPLVVKDGRNKA